MNLYNFQNIEFYLFSASSPKNSPVDNSVLLKSVPLDPIVDGLLIVNLSVFLSEQHWHSR